MGNMHHARSIVAAGIAAWALVACGWQDPVADNGGSANGGGTGNAGGSTGGVVTPPSPVTPAPDPAAPVATNNIAADGRNWLNYRRSQIGMAALTQNAIIDKAAQGHSDYQRINNVVTHDQTSGLTGFTGTTLENRLKAAGYSFTATNAIGEVISAVPNQTGFYMAEELVTAIYHRFVMFEPVFREVGTGSGTTSSGYAYFTADFVTNNGYGTGLAAGTMATWPVNGQTGVQVNFMSNTEEPDPVPDVNEVGYPISVHTNLTRKLTVQSFTVRARNGSANLATRLLMQSNDTNTTSPSVAAIIPLAPLSANTVYDVSFSGAIDGTAISRTWSFTTK